MAGDPSNSNANHSPTKQQPQLPTTKGSNGGEENESVATREGVPQRLDAAAASAEDISEWRQDDVMHKNYMKEGQEQSQSLEQQQLVRMNHERSDQQNHQVEEQNEDDDEQDDEDEDNASETRVNSLEQSIMEPLKLKILILSGTAIGGKELLSIHPCVNLLKLDLSSNKIRQFPRGLSFASLVSLRLLFLHDNLINDVETLYKIFEIPKLTYLTLFKNPLSSKWSLRHFIVNSMPSLFAFDFNAIADEERMPTERFFALSPSTKINWPLVDQQKPIEQQPRSDEWYLRSMHKEISLISRRFTENSPCVIIQRMYRGYACRKQLNLRVRSAEERLNISQQVSSTWKKFAEKKAQLKLLLEERGKEYLLFDNSQYRLCRSKDKLRRVLRTYLSKVRAQQKWQMAARIIIKVMMRMRNFLQSYSFALFSNHLQYQSRTSPALVEQPKNVTMYFHKNQLPVYYEILDFMRRYVKEEDQSSYETLLASNSVCKARDVLAIRVCESTAGTNQQFWSKYPFNAMMRPTLKSKIIIARGGNKYYDPKMIALHPFFQRFHAQITLPNMDRALLRFRLTKNEQKKYSEFGAKIEKFQKQSYECLMEISMSNSLAHSFIKASFAYNHSIQTNTKLGRSQQYNSGVQFMTEVNQQQDTTNEDDDKNKLPKQPSAFFLVFFQSYLMQVSSAIKIQKVWRSYKTRGQQLQVFRMIQRKRACMKIQHWFRDMRWRHKRCFLCLASSYLANIQTSTMYMHFATYMSLNSIFVKTHNHFTLTFFEQSSVVSFSPANGTVRLQWDAEDPKTAVAISKNQQVFPGWLNLQKGLKKHEDQYIGDMMHLLNVGTKVSLFESSGMKFVKITFDSLSELKYRATAVGLLSYRFRNPRFFIKLYSLQQIQAFSYILTEETDLKLTYSKAQFKDWCHFLYESTLVFVYLDIDLPYDSQRCLSQIEYPIANPRSLFLSSVNRTNFNERCKRVACMTGVAEITFYKEDRLFSIGGSSGSSRATRPSMKATAIGNPVKLSAFVHVIYMDSIYFSDLQRVVSFQRLGKAEIVEQAFQPIDSNLAHSKGFRKGVFTSVKTGTIPPISEETHRSNVSKEKPPGTADSKASVEVKSILRAESEDEGGDTVEEIETKKDADKLKETSLASRFLKNTIVSRDLVTQPDSEILRNHKHQLQSLLKEREDESLRVKQQCNYNYSMRTHLLTRAFALEAENQQNQDSLTKQQQQQQQQLQQQQMQQQIDQEDSQMRRQRLYSRSKATEQEMLADIQCNL